MAAILELAENSSQINNKGSTPALVQRRAELMDIISGKLKPVAPDTTEVKAVQIAQEAVEEKKAEIENLRKQMEVEMELEAEDDDDDEEAEEAEEQKRNVRPLVVVEDEAEEEQRDTMGHPVMMQSVLFPTITYKKGHFPTTLHFNTAASDKNSSSLDGKKILFVLDNTGSMGEYINYRGQYSKAYTAKKLIEQVLSKRPTNDYDVMVFNDHPDPVLCKIAAIPEPNGSTYFSPLVDEIVKVVTPTANYCSVIFLSDGLPSEPLPIAQEAIRKIGNISREMHCNPVAVAIGHDADGASCALFAGNRGYNCFINEHQNLEAVADDISQGIGCKYKMLEKTGQFVPIEADGKYYCVDSDMPATTVAPNKFLINKYLNLVIMQHINDPTIFVSLSELVAKCSKLLTDEKERKEIIDHFQKILNDVHKNCVANANSPACMSSNSAGYRAASKQV